MLNPGSKCFNCRTVHHRASDFCCRNCRDQYRRHESREERALELGEDEPTPRGPVDDEGDFKRCDYTGCLNTLEGKRSDARFCSTACRVAHFREQG